MCVEMGVCGDEMCGGVWGGEVCGDEMCGGVWG